MIHMSKGTCNSSCCGIISMDKELEDGSMIISCVSNCSRATGRNKSRKDEMRRRLLCEDKGLNKRFYLSDVEAPMMSCSP
jgi:hypothetical protein